MKYGIQQGKFLMRVKRVNEIYIKQREKGYSNEFIFKEYIRDQFYISRSTFYNYLAVPYQAELKRMKEEERERKHKTEKNTP